MRSPIVVGSNGRHALPIGRVAAHILAAAATAAVVHGAVAGPALAQAALARPVSSLPASQAATAARGRPVEGGRLLPVTAEDPTGVRRTLTFDAPGYTVVGVTDRAHKASLSDWFQLTAEQSGSTPRYALVALPSVPGFVKGMIRSGFGEAGSVHYLLDWGGSLTDALTGGALPMVIVVSGGGTVARVLTGAPDSAGVQALWATLLAPVVGAR